MAINFDKAFGIHVQGMLVRAERAEVLASNIANADTPGYKAKDINFHKMLLQASQQQEMGMTRTNKKHFDTRMSLNDELQYRTPSQPDTGDGNTVDAQVERNLYLQNSLEYQASLQFLNGSISGLRKAITGG